MRLYSPFTLAVLGVTMVQAKCYTMSGDMYGQSVDGANEVVAEFCDHSLAGYFVEGQAKYRCFQLNQELKAEFWVIWKGRGGITLNSKDCKMRLKNEIVGCTLGGESVVADWYFRFDPNWGKC
ncbi:hypothetical protein AA0119_g12882 [Alternaria tenuissima]|uniref:Glycan binding protein Y3-like domain-containing protein n=3 Tax=Alternaria sect. Alternaria TaxID=2499237 RepID=A0A4Q4MZ04_ALTAL|nr:hypothetical protein AG0111_0g11689 [Alternaria gaisen]RYN63512.1 hypothetical protein AA0117_g12708 [Alternaria alternata]RYN86460.1 hypothetical protein AA0119_g12882 [Alternaria tenuissima]RYO04009.1 hypothetical protein AA0121_g12889 [Alternaria tenuissima]RYO47918.1 hypothetical protein AA0116_g12851 [Alternaria tenuissima]